jgi:hypothetical protein
MLGDISKIMNYMKNLNKKPLVWAVAVLLLGWLMIENQSFETFVLLIFAVIVAKQIEILNK